MPALRDTLRDCEDIRLKVEKFNPLRSDKQIEMNPV